MGLKGYATSIHLYLYIAVRLWLLLRVQGKVKQIMRLMGWETVAGRTLAGFQDFVVLMNL